ncbi:MAG: hypothetical protein ACK2US_01885 [Anaerolineae bacterium]
MFKKKVLYLLLVCPLLTACTIGIVRREAVVQVTVLPPTATATAIVPTPTHTPPPPPTPTPTATHTPPTPPPPQPTTIPTKPPTPTPTPCALSIGPALQPRLDLNPEYVSALSCPTSYQQSSWAAEQAFQRGRMFWKKDRDVAYILYNDSSTYQIKDDLYVEGDPDDACPELGSAPEELYKPVRGFNRQWCSDPDVRDKLGWALEEEAGFYTTWQEFEHGLVLLSRANHVFILYDDGTWDYIE